MKCNQGKTKKIYCNSESISLALHTFNPLYIITQDCLSPYTLQNLHPGGKIWCIKTACVNKKYAYNRPFITYPMPSLGQLIISGCIYNIPVLIKISWLQLLCCISEEPVKNWIFYQFFSGRPADWIWVYHHLIELAKQETKSAMLKVSYY